VDDSIPLRRRKACRNLCNKIGVRIEKCEAVSKRFSLLIIGAAAETADQEADAERNGGRRVGALLDSRTKKVAGFAGAFPNRFRGVGRGFLGLPIKILQGTFCLPRPALHLRLHVTGRASESLFNLTANVLGGARKAIISHGHSPENCRFNGRSRYRFLPARKWPVATRARREFAG
jgi:hypothetical protein